jgi:uncharacterized membrane protein
VAHRARRTSLIALPALLDGRARLYMCPHTMIYSSQMRLDTTIYVSSYYSICVLILLYVSAYYYICVRIHVSSYYCICVLILLYMCPHTTIYVSSYLHTDCDGWGFPRATTADEAPSARAAPG